VACHTDVHGNELGSDCQRCHGDTAFAITAYTHTRASDFFGGQHAPARCEGCHRPFSAAAPATSTAERAAIRYTTTPTGCVSCHADVHLGQVGIRCEGCHSIDTARFAVTGFDHARTRFPLTGKHAGVECRACHKPETGQFASGHGTAVRLSGIATACVSCHADVHLGQLKSGCETCHTATTFRIQAYEHRNRALAGFFVGPHAAARCSQCHAEVSGRFPAGTGRAVKFVVDSGCTTCHLDAHNGQLGDRCIDCHKLDAGGRQ
jgi:hypothetical protein